MRDLTARDNARRIVIFDDSATIMPRPPVYEVAHSGANHEGFAGGGHDVPVGTRWIDIWGTEWHKSHAGVMGFPKGHPLIDMGRTPNQTILVDYVGLANFALHLFDMEAEMAALYEALLMRFRRLIEIVAEGPGRYVCVLENFTSETLGPRRYAQLLMPVYEEFFPTLQQAGKIVGVHYDGRLASCKDLVARAPIDLIESLTPPPEGDMSLAEARQAWPDTLFWSNINIACYALPPDELKALIAERAAQGAPDGSKLAFEVSEQLPVNWYDSLRVVLDTLREIA